MGQEQHDPRVPPGRAGDPDQPVTREFLDRFAGAPTQETLERYHVPIISVDLTKAGTLWNLGKWMGQTAKYGVHTNDPSSLHVYVYDLSFCNASAGTACEPGYNGRTGIQPYIWIGFQFLTGNYDSAGKRIELDDSFVVPYDPWAWMRVQFGTSSSKTFAP